MIRRLLYFASLMYTFRLVDSLLTVGTTALETQSKGHEIFPLFMNELFHFQVPKWLLQTSPLKFKTPHDLTIH